LISPNNHESLLHTFQQWKPANNETLQSPQNDFEVCVFIYALTFCRKFLLPYTINR
jgi:hypothetical protein